MLLAGIAVLQVFSLFCSVRSLQLADASVVVPYQYTLILWSVLFGWQIFDEVPDAYTMIGAAIIVAAGLYIFWRERAVRIGSAHDRPTAFHARRHRPDADRRVPVLVQRCGRQMAGRDLLGRAAAADPQRHHADPARAVHLARRAGRVHVRAAARPAGAAHRAVDARSRDVLLGGRIPAARRRGDVLSRRADLRDGDLGAVPRGARRLAALERGAGRLPRRRHRAAAVRRHADAAGADRARRQPLLRAADDRDARAARDQRHGADAPRSISARSRSAPSRRRSPG